MRPMRNVTLTIITTLVALLILSGCQTESQSEATPAKTACIELMQKMPVYYEDFEF
ncbi:MAG: hypothetical protein JW845_09000 [Dehalococcoidales bacterium]|nr:hypothetical protein [Dehalococcoidales bacterium]